MPGSNYILTLLATATLIYLFYPEESKVKEFPLPPNQSVEKSKHSLTASWLRVDEKEENSKSDYDNESLNDNEDFIDGKPSLFERLTSMDDINEAKKFVLNFKAPPGEEVERFEFEDGSVYTQSELEDGAHVTRKFRPDGSQSMLNYLSEKMSLSRIENDQRELRTFRLENRELGEQIVVDYNKAGTIQQRVQLIDGLWFQQTYDDKGKALQQEVIDYETLEKVSFNYFFNTNN